MPWVANITFSLTGDLQKLINNQHGQLFAKGSFAGAELDVDANITPFSSGDDSTANISLNWKDTNQIASLLDLDLQHVAPFIYHYRTQCIK